MIQADHEHAQGVTGRVDVPLISVQEPAFNELPIPEMTLMDLVRTHEAVLDTIPESDGHVESRSDEIEPVLLRLKDQDTTLTIVRLGCLRDTSAPSQEPSGRRCQSLSFC